MTLRSIVANVANEAGYTVESGVVNSTEVTTKQLYAIANRINRQISEAYPWPTMYASFWNSATRWRILGPMSEQEYAEVRGFGINTAVYQRFQIRGLTNSELLIYPTPGPENNGNVIIFEYIADRSVRPQTWTSGVTYSANSYTFYNGNYYTTSVGGVTGATAPTHTSGSASDGGVTWDYYNGPYNEFLADTDSSIFNEKLVEQGILERFADIHGLVGVPKTFTMELHEEFSRQKVSKVVYAGGQNRANMFARAGVAVFGTWI
jgi:hypothetical protein